MTFKALLVCFLTVTVTSSFDQLHSIAQVERIVGGKTAVPGQFPYLVSLQWGLPPLIPYKHFCGGSILNSKWILTAGHCVRAIPGAGRVLVKAGKHNISRTEIGEQQVQIRSTFVHSNYTGGVAPYDVGLIFLLKPLVLNKNVAKIGLPIQGATHSGIVTLSGWGSVSKTSRPLMPTVLQYVDLPIISLASCRRAIQSIVSTADVHVTNICTGPLNAGLASCSGDSGGPLVLKQNGQTIIVGIASWGVFPCGSYGAPSVYTKTSAFTNWITTVIKRYS